MCKFYVDVKNRRILCFTRSEDGGGRGTTKFSIAENAGSFMSGKR